MTSLKDFELIKANYLKLRSSLIKYLGNFNDVSYYYQPTDKSNSVAWIVPHVVAFEKVMVTDKIKRYKFKRFITQEDVEKYKPAVDGYAFKKKELMKIEEAIKLLNEAQNVSLKFLDDTINGSDSTIDVDFEIAFDKYLLNFSHETEHLGQLKYLLGTYKRTRI